MQGNRCFFPLTITLLFVLVVGARFVSLEALPRYIHNDEVAAADVIKPFLTTPMESPLWGYSIDGGHSNLGPFISAIPAYFVQHIDLLTLRIGAALSGIGSIIFFSLAVLRLYGHCTMALFLVAVGPYFFHIHYSRSGYTYIHAALFMTVLCWSFARFQQTLSAGSALLAGAILGLSVMTYSVSYILPAPFACAMLWVFLSPQYRARFGEHRFRKFLQVSLISFVGFFLVLTPQIIYTSLYGFSTSSRLRSQSLFVHVRGADIYSTLTLFFEKYWALLGRTCRIFISSDIARQGAGPLLAEPISQLLVLLGVMILIYRCIRRDPFAMLVLSIVAFSVVGSALMIEANFSPHFILLTIILPYIGILPLEVVFVKLFSSRKALFSLFLMALVIPWTVWNYNHWLAADERRSDINTWLLRLPIDRERIKSLANCSPYPAHIRENMYPLMYPQATIRNVPFTDPVASLSEFLDEQPCPCMVLFENRHDHTIETWLGEQGYSFSKLENKTGIVFVIE